MKFDLEYFKNNKVAINCETEDEARELLKILKEYGVKWGDDNELDINDSCWDIHENETCYEIEFGELNYSCCIYYEKESAYDYEIIKFKDIEFEREDKMSDNKNKKEYKGWELLKLIDEGIIKEGDTFKDNLNYMYKICEGIMSLYIAYYDTAEEVENSILINRTFTKIQKPITFFEAMNKVNEGYKVINEYNMTDGYWHKDSKGRLLWKDKNDNVDLVVGMDNNEINSKWYIYKE